VHYRRVEVTEDTKIPNAVTVKVLKQDHTLGNMIRAQLLSMPEVLFAGYKVPHPLHPYFLLKVQTDGTVSPTAVLEQACQKLIVDLGKLETKFKREFSFKEVEPTEGQDVYGTVGPDGASGGAWTTERDYLDF